MDGSVSALLGVLDSGAKGQVKGGLTLLEVRDKELSLAEKELSNKGRVLLSARAKLMVDQIRVEVKDTLQNKVLQKMETELSKVSEMIEIKGLAVIAGMLMIKTIPIQCHDSHGQLRELGAFEIQLNLNTGQLKWQNKGPEYHKRQAPNIAFDGTVMIGEVLSAIPFLLAQGDLEAIVQLAINTIKYPDADCIRYAEFWPLAKTV